MHQGRNVKMLEWIMLKKGKYIIPVDSILERDIDLLLLEELTVDMNFCKWFVKNLNLPTFSDIIGVWKSISEFGLGETDILFSYKSNGKRINVLIENKLDSSFQEEQYERYNKRVIEYKKYDDCDEAFCVLVAPEYFCSNQDYFQKTISYETIAEKLFTNNTTRSLFKKDLLLIATEKLRRGYQPVNSEMVQKFWISYWNYLTTNHPSLIMKKPEVVPFNSDWPAIYDKRLNNVVFYHKLSQGYIDATFKTNLKEIISLKYNFPTGAKLIQHKKNFSIRLFSDAIDRTKNFNEQIDIVEKSLIKLESLRDYLLVS